MEHPPPPAVIEISRRDVAYPSGTYLTDISDDIEVVPIHVDMRRVVPVPPDGAFYAWADCSRFNASSWDFCFDMMKRAHVALTPGRDFGPLAAERYLRLSFASSLPQLQAAMDRLARELG